MFPFGTESIMKTNSTQGNPTLGESRTGKEKDRLPLASLWIGFVSPSESHYQALLTTGLIPRTRDALI